MLSNILQCNKTRRQQCIETPQLDDVLHSAAPRAGRAGVSISTPANHSVNSANGQPIQRDQKFDGHWVSADRGGH
jgi:hypothetical protein